MQLQHYKAAIAAVWILAVCAAGFAAGATSVATLAIVAAAAVLPPIAMLRFWRDPEESMSESIQQARR